MRRTALLPGVGTPCTLKAGPEVAGERGVRLVAVSPQKPDGSLTMQQKHGLAFTVVSDPRQRHRRMIAALGRAVMAADGHEAAGTSRPGRTVGTQLVAGRDALDCLVQSGASMGACRVSR